MKITSPIVALLAGGALAASMFAADINASKSQPAASVGAGLAPVPPGSTSGNGKPQVTASASAPTAGKSTKPSAKPAPPKPPPGTLIAVPGTAHLKGDPKDWAASATMNSTATVSGNDTGVRASWQVVWDDTALYLRATVHDPQIVQPFGADPGQLFRGDSVGLELGSDATALSDGAALRPGDGHYLFGPRPGGGLVSVVNRVRAGTFVNGRADDRVRARETEIDSGYVVEIEIPWTVVGVVPRPGRVLAANLNVSDGSQNGVLRNMKSTNPRRSSKNQSHPGTWQKLELRG